MGEETWIVVSGPSSGAAKGDVEPPPKSVTPSPRRDRAPVPLTESVVGFRTESRPARPRQESKS